MTFVQIQRRKAYTQVAEQVLDYIRTRKLEPPARLPSVRELEAELGVSRPTIREALSALELAGVVEIRTGQGTFVRGAPLRDRTMAFTLDQGESPRELLQVRFVLEPEAVRLAASQGAKKDIDAAAEALDAFRAAVVDDHATTISDIQFHLAIARASGNSIIYRFMVGVGDYLDQALWKSLRLEMWKQRSLGADYVRQHENTLRAIQQGDGESGAQSMLEHLRSAEKDLYTEV